MTAEGGPSPPVETPTAAGPPAWRRRAEVVAFVAVWMALGFALPYDPDLYLLIGLPLTVAFQRGVRRTPIRALWVREAPPFRLGWAGRATAVALALLPMMTLIDAVVERQWVASGWAGAGVIGAVGAGYATRQVTRATLRDLVACVATAGAIGVAVMIVVALGEGPLRPDPGAGVLSLLIYLPICFALEEVTFRGALDSHAYRPGDRGRWPSALLVAALWGLWHLPAIPRDEVGPWTAAELVLVHTLVGVPLSLFWRRSGNLAVPAFTHALLDGVRNALLSGLE